MFAKLKNKLNLIFTKSWSFLRPKNKLGLVSFIILSSLIITVWFVFTPITSADGILSDIGAGIRDMFTSIFLALAGFFIKLTFFVLKFIIEVAGYNGYIDSPAVTVGWVMVRDLTNMFFVVILLIISFGTILGLEQYEYKKLLIKLLMAAVVVNFSRIICGVIIDIAQVVMITFINGIAATASGNLVNMFNVQDIFKLGSGGDAGSLNGNALFIASVAALTFGTMMLVTMGTFLLLLMARMAMLWVLIVLSPFAFVLNVLPQTEKYASQWWSQFGGHVVGGPVIAFFLWLSFVTVGTGNAHDEIKNHNSNPSTSLIGSADPDSKEESTGITSVMSWTKMANFAIAIAMLLAGAKMATELGMAGGEMMGKAKDIGKKVAMYASGYQAARWGAGKAAAGAKAAGKFVAMKFPVVGGDEWLRRGRRVKAWASYKTTKEGWFGLPSTEERLIAAGKRVNKVYGKEEQNIGEQPEDVKNLVESRDAVMAAAREEKDEERRKRFEDMSDKLRKRLEEKGYGVEDTEDGKTGLNKEFSTGSKLWGRLGLALWTTSSFKEEYTKDAEKTAELAHEQMEHIVSTSKTPMGKNKTRAEVDLHELESTGGNIKSQKMEAIHEKKHHQYHDIEKALEKKKEEGKTDSEALKELEGQFSKRLLFDFTRARKGRSSKEDADQIKATLSAEEQKQAAKERARLFATKEGKKRESTTVKSKSETKQIEEQLNVKKQLEELKAIKKLLEGKGAGTQEQINARKAEIEQVDFDMKELGEQNVARERDAYLRNVGKDSEAVNLDNVLAKQTKARIDRQGVGDYVLAMERIGAQQRRVAELEKKNDPKALQARRSLSEMQMAAEGKHGLFADGGISKILKGMGMSAERTLNLDPTSIRKLQAQWLATKIGKPVDPNKLEDAMKEFRSLHGEQNAEAILEQSRLALENGAGQGYPWLAGLLRTKIDSAGRRFTNLTNPDEIEDGEGLNYIDSRRTNAISGSKIRSLAGGISGVVDKTEMGQSVLISPESINMLARVLTPLTSNMLTDIDEFVKQDLASLFNNSIGKIPALIEKLVNKETGASDKKALYKLFGDALNRMPDKLADGKDNPNKKEMEEILKKMDGTIQEQERQGRNRPNI